MCGLCQDLGHSHSGRLPGILQLEPNLDDEPNIVFTWLLCRDVEAKLAST